MKRIALSIFILLSLPYFGIPNRYDTWIILAVFVFVMWTLYDMSYKKGVHKEMLEWLKHHTFNLDSIERKMMRRTGSRK